MKYSPHILFVSVACLFISSCNVEDVVKNNVIDYANPPAETYSTADEPPRVLPANPAGCPTWEKNQTVLINESMRLVEGCKYDRVKIIIRNKSDLVFDCNGAELNGLDKEFRQKPETTYPEGRDPLDIGILVQSSENYQSRNITIKNCNLKNYVRGIRVNLAMSEASISDLKNNINVEALENHLRTVSPTNIRVEHSTINFSHKDGVYIDRFVNGFVLDSSSINSTGVVGLYLDSGSANSLIRNSTFTKNGYSRYLIGSRTIKKELEDYSREAIAIDSSMNNRIEGNTFSNNSRGAVFLYKNCNEFHTNPNQIPRYQSADGNVISGNQFDDERVGVWLASRQSQDLRDFECGAPKVATGTISYGLYERTAYYYEDFAKNNQVLSNTFNNIRYAVIVEDDENEVTGNTFTGSATTDVTVGTKYRTEELSHPVTNTIIKNNHFNSTASKKIHLRYSPVNTVITGNTPAEVNQ